MNSSKSPGVTRPQVGVLTGVCLLLGLSSAFGNGMATGAFWLWAVSANLAGWLLLRQRKGYWIVPGRRGRGAVLGLALFLVFVAFARGSVGQQRLIGAARDGDLGAMRLLLLCGTNPDGPQLSRLWGRTPLGAAVEQENTDAIRLLLECGADPNRPDAHGWTPLALAKYRERTDLESLLRARGALDGPMPVFPKDHPETD